MTIKKYLFYAFICFMALSLLAYTAYVLYDIYKIYHRPTTFECADTVLVNYEIHNDVKDVVTTFINLRAKKDTNVCNLYADTVSFFYGITNFSKLELKEFYQNLWKNSNIEYVTHSNKMYVASNNEYFVILQTEYIIKDVNTPHKKVAFLVEEKLKIKDLHITHLGEKHISYDSITTYSK